LEHSSGKFLSFCHCYTLMNYHYRIAVLSAIVGAVIIIPLCLVSPLFLSSANNLFIALFFISSLMNIITFYSFSELGKAEHATLLTHAASAVAIVTGLVFLIYLFHPHKWFNVLAIASFFVWGAVNVTFSIALKNSTDSTMGKTVAWLSMAEGISLLSVIFILFTPLITMVRNIVSCLMFIEIMQKEK